jgi:hypothetical protein
MFTTMAILVCLGVVGTGAPAGATTAAPTDCGAVAAGSIGSAGVTKAVTLSPTTAGRIRADVVLTSTAGLSRALLFDCTWVDRDGDHTQDRGEPSRITVHVVSFQDGGARFATTVMSAPNGPVCDRAVLLALTSSHRLVVVHTNVACGDLRPPVVPESSAPALLGASALALLTALVLLGRRRGRRGGRLLPA